MFRKSAKCLTIGIALVALFATTSTANAGWWHRWGCWDPCFTPVCATPCFTPCCSPCVRPCLKPCWHNWCRPSCVLDCCAPVCCDAAPACCGETTIPMGTPTLAAPQQPTPAAPAPAVPTPPAPAAGLPPAPPAEPTTPPPPAAKPTADLHRADAGTLTLLVPEGAKVFVNGYATKSQGTQRQYISYGLKAGMGYNFDIQVLAIIDGKPREERRTVTLTAGQQSSVAFLNAKSTATLALNW